MVMVAVRLGGRVGRHFEQGLIGLIISWREESKGRQGV